MSTRRYPVLALSLGVALFALPACSTQEISPDPVLIPGGAPDENSGGLQIAVAPREADFAEQQANTSVRTDQYHVFIDGAHLAWTSGAEPPAPFVVSEGGLAVIGYFAAGPHHFEIRAGAHGPTVFAGAGAITAGSTTRLYLFGPAGAVEGRFVSWPEIVPPGTVHVSLINLIQGDQSVEAVSCVDVSHCSPVSPALATGGVFAADIPLDATQEWPNGRFVVSNGAAIGYRQVPTATQPNPPLLPLGPNLYADGPRDYGFLLAVAPIYMSREGNVQESF